MAPNQGCSEMPLVGNKIVMGCCLATGRNFSFVSCRDAGSKRPPRWKLGHDNLLCFFFQSSTRGSEVSKALATDGFHLPLCRKARSVFHCFICGCQEHEFSNNRHNNERMLCIGHTLFKPKMVKVRRGTLLSTQVNRQAREEAGDAR